MPRTIPIEALLPLFATTILGMLCLYSWIRYRDGNEDLSLFMFVVLTATTCLWALFETVHIASQTRDAMVFWGTTSTILGSLCSVVWLLFMLAYTDREHHFTWRRATFLLSPVAILFLAFVFAPDAVLADVSMTVYRGEQFVETTFSTPVVLLLLYFTLFGLGGTVLAGELIVKRRYQHWRQGGALAIAGFLPTLAATVDIAGYVPHPAFNAVPVTYAVTGPLLGYAVFRYDLLDPAATVHRAAFETMPEVVLVVDDDRRIVGMNPAGRQLFGVDEAPTGKRVQSVLADYPDLVDRLVEQQHVDTEVGLVVEGELKHFSMTTRSVEFRTRSGGTLLLLKDMTALKNREQDLELLKRIQSRVLRHNIRNDIQIADGLARLISAEPDEAVEQRAEEIVETLEQLSETTEKARQLATVVDATDDRTDQEVCKVVERVVERARKQHPGAKIETNTPRMAWATAHTDLETALWNLVENAVVHSDATVSSVEVTVETTDDSIAVTVADNGPGIPDHELAVLDEQSESALQHGSGAGLWLVEWIAEMSGGSLAFDTDDTGTTVTLELPATDQALAETEQSGEEQSPAGTWTVS